MSRHECDCGEVYSNLEMLYHCQANQHYRGKVRKLAREEIAEEDFDADVEAEKVRIRTHVPWWHRIIPFTITVKRRKPND